MAWKCLFLLRSVYIIIPSSHYAQNTCISCAGSSTHAYVRLFSGNMFSVVISNQADCDQSSLRVTDTDTVMFVQYKKSEKSSE